MRSEIVTHCSLIGQVLMIQLISRTRWIQSLKNGTKGKSVKSVVSAFVVSSQGGQK